MMVLMPKDTRIGWVDAGRFLAALLVVGFHVAYEFTLDPALRIVGFFAVSLFFIISGFSLASRYPDTARFSLEWLKRRWLRIAVVYYPALTAIYLLFTWQVTDAGVYALLAHFLFIDFLFPQTAYAIISPAWFIIPLMALYVVFPFLNAAMKKWKWAVIVAFVAMVLARAGTQGDLTSFSPLFFLGEFCFGIAVAHGNRVPAYAGAVIALFPNPLMALPYVAFWLMPLADKAGRIVAPIARRTLEIFLFHECIMKTALGKWKVYGLGVELSLALTVAALLLVMLLTSWLGKRLLPQND